MAALTDVRGQGFDRLSPLAEALAWIVAEARPLPAESVAPADAVGRALADPALRALLAARGFPA